MKSINNNTDYKEHIEIINASNVLRQSEPSKSISPNQSVRIKIEDKQLRFLRKPDMRGKKLIAQCLFRGVWRFLSLFRKHTQWLYWSFQIQSTQMPQQGGVAFWGQTQTVYSKSIASLSRVELAYFPTLKGDILTNP